MSVQMSVGNGELGYVRCSGTYIGSCVARSYGLQARFHRLPRAIAKLNLTCVLSKVMRDNPHWTETRAKEAVHDYRYFLALALLPGSITPSPDIDEMWHAHILFMRKYERDCNSVFGHILYHTPHAPNARKHILAERSQCWKRMPALFQENFGFVPKGYDAKSKNICDRGCGR